MRRGLSTTICPQNSDKVFDTVYFGEVPSRLGRAKGKLEKLAKEISVNPGEDFASEAIQLLNLTLLAAKQLNRMVSTSRRKDLTIPKSLCKERVNTILNSQSVSGEEIGWVRCAQRLTIKNVWDYPEMVRREILPSEEQQEQVQKQLTAIQKAAKRITSRLA